MIYDQLIITLFLVIIPIFISRILLERGMKTLDDAAKIRLLDGFSKQRKITSYIMLAILIIYLLLLKFFSDYALLIVGVFGMLFMLYFVMSRILNYRKVEALGASEHYLKMYKLSAYLIGTGFLAVGLQLWWLQHSAMNQ